MRRWCVVQLFFLTTLLPVAAQQHAIDSLKNALPLAEQDTAKLHILANLADLIQDSSSLRYTREILRITANYEEEAKPELRRTYRSYRALACSRMGSAEGNTGHIEPSLSWFFRSAQLYWSMADTVNTGDVLLDISFMQVMAGDYVKAINSALLGMKCMEAADHPEGMAEAFRQIGIIYYRIGDDVKAIRYLKRSLAVSPKDMNPVAYTTLATVYSDAGHDVWALHYLRLAVAHLDSGMGAPYYYFAGWMKNMEGHPEEALNILKKGYAEACSLGHVKYRIADALLMAKIYLHRDELKLAEQLGREAYELSLQVGAEDFIGKAAYLLEPVYMAQGKYREAAAMLQVQIKELKASKDAAVRNNVIEQQLVYELERREKEMASERERRLGLFRMQQQQRLERKNTWIIGLSSLAFILLLVTWGVYKFQRQRHTIAAQQNYLLRQRLLVAQMNPHFIFNALNAIQNYIYRREPEVAGEYLGRFSALIRTILEFSRKDYINVEQELQFLHLYLEAQQLRFPEKLSYRVEVDDRIHTLDTLIPPMLSQPYIENAIEHGIFYKEEPGQVIVRIFYQGDDLVYEVEDDGVGLEVSAEKNRQRKKHESTGSAITSERLLRRKDRPSVIITDRSKEEPGATGVRVRFIIPHKTC